MRTVSKYVQRKTSVTLVALTLRPDIAENTTLIRLNVRYVYIFGVAMTFRCWGASFESALPSPPDIFFVYK